MNTVWSKNIFGIDALKTSREFRFNNRFSNLYLQVLPIQRGMKLLDLGCGPGSFTRCVYEWFQGELQIEGIDLDNGYIDFCKEIAARDNYDITYTVGDACKTSFPDEGFDITTSFTVAQHVENSSFFKEQYRILKRGGYIVVMDVGGYTENVERQLEVIPISQEELNILATLVVVDKVDNTIKAEQWNKHKNPDYMKMEILNDIGFNNITHQKIKIFGSPDNPQPDDFSRLIIDTFYCHYIDLAISDFNTDDRDYVKQIAMRYIDLVNERKAKRIKMYENSVKLWDSIETDVNIIIGRK